MGLAFGFLFLASHLGIESPWAAVGADWVEATATAAFPVRSQHVSLVFNGKMWVIAGTGAGLKNDVWSSADGVTWIQETPGAAFPPRAIPTGLVYNPSTGSGLDGKMWVMGGWGGSMPALSDVWSSTDGATWTLETASPAFGARSHHSSVVFNPLTGSGIDGKMWIIGGGDGSTFTSEVWSSTDGVTWILENAAAAFPGRGAHTSLVFNGRMWVIGGTDGTSKSDVWSSVDGVTWIQETSSAAFGARYWQTSIVFNSKMWLIGGTTFRNDVWSSVDGATWIQETPSAAFVGRYSHSTVDFAGKMWVIGGSNAVSTYKNDVWYSPPNPTPTPTSTVTPTPADTPPPVFTQSMTPSSTMTKTLIFTKSPTYTVTPTPGLPIQLSHNFFNPRIQTLDIEGRPETSGVITVDVYNIAAEKVRHIADWSATQGLPFKLEWDGKNQAGKFVGNGVYIIMMKSTKGVILKKIIVLK